MNAIPLIQRVVAVLWPAFITAGIATVLFTTAFDPAVIFFDYDISRLGIYTIYINATDILGNTTIIGPTTIIGDFSDPEITIITPEVRDSATDAPDFSLTIAGLIFKSCINPILK